VSARLSLALVAASLASVSALPLSVAAEDASAQAEARAFFEEGLALAAADRWAEALSAFRRSATLVSRASTSYNIANALYRLDRPVEALSELDEHDRMPEVRADPAALARSDQLRSLIAQAVGEVVLTVTPATARVFVDGSPSVLDGRERVILLNPGLHFIRVTRDGYEPHRQEVRVERGSRQAHAVELQPRVTALAPDPSFTMDESTSRVTAGVTESSAPEDVADDRKPFVKRPGFWVMIGVIAAAGIGAGVAVAVLRKDDAPACGTTGDCATTQGLTVSSF